MKTGIVRLPHFRGVKQCKRMVVLRGFNLIISALFGLVIHHDPCEDEPGYVLWYLAYDFLWNSLRKLGGVKHPLENGCSSWMTLNHCPMEKWVVKSPFPIH